MKDGGMGSLFFIADKQRSDRKFGTRVAEKQFMDSDNIPILVSLNIDSAGILFELDIWKADFTPLKKYPAC